jgi:hypothetical protein
MVIPHVSPDNNNFKECNRNLIFWCLFEVRIFIDCNALLLGAFVSHVNNIENLWPCRREVRHADQLCPIDIYSRSLNFGCSQKSIPVVIPYNIISKDVKIQSNLPRVSLVETGFFKDNVSGVPQIELTVINEGPIIRYHYYWSGEIECYRYDLKFLVDRPHLLILKLDIIHNVNLPNNIVPHIVCPIDH